jgi:hypothetical protein
MFEWLRQQLGKPYDYTFNSNNNDAMYCTKLVAKAMNVAGFTINERDFLRRSFYIPDDFFQTEKMTVVYRKSETLVAKIISCLPLAGVVTLWLTGVTPLWIICLIYFVAGWIQYIYPLRTPLQSPSINQIN